MSEAMETRKEKERLEELLLEGMQSEQTEMTRDDWDALRREALRQFEARRAPKQP
jgi:hypothetical protein